MALRSPSTLINSEFNQFLFAPIGEEGNGMMLSVVSALARLEIDPWEEAARLAGLPNEIAAAALGQLIDRLPRGLWVRSDTPEIATRLIALLPQRTRTVGSDQPRDTKRAKMRLSVIEGLLILALTASLLFTTIGHRGSGLNRATDGSASAITSPAAER